LEDVAVHLDHQRVVLDQQDLEPALGGLDHPPCPSAEHVVEPPPIPLVRNADADPAHRVLPPPPAPPPTPPVRNADAAPAHRVLPPRPDPDHLTLEGHRFQQPGEAHREVDH